MPNTFTASHSPRCLYHDSLRNFCAADETLVFGKLCENYHGDALTTTRDAWIGELAILKQVLSRYSDREGQIIFEYDIFKFFLNRKINWEIKKGKIIII
jgi:hypothetical protein